MKTFAGDDYQVKLMDNGGVKVTIYNMLGIIYITYNPNNEKPWSRYTPLSRYSSDVARSETIAGLNLDLCTLKPLYKALKELNKALKALNKQDLIDSEITFMSEKQTEKQTDNDLELVHLLNLLQGEKKYENNLLK